MNIWSRLGISVALLGIFCILCSEMLERDGFYDQNRRQIAAGFGGVGIVLFLVGRALNLKRATAAREQASDFHPEEEHAEIVQGPFILANLAYWGPMLAAFALVVLFIPARDRAVIPVAARTPAPPKTKEAPAPPTNPEPVKVVAPSNTVVFPTVKLQGITQRGPQSSALINGETYFIGDHVGPAKIVSIFEASVVFEMNGQFRSLTLGK